MDKCNRCDTKRYGYTDGTHTVFICFRCGAFEGVSGGDEKFLEEITRDPETLLQMIKDHHFRAI